jgi:L-alanine-DL-glutamate epimerase-like enolase superfamily enzyme
MRITGVRTVLYEVELSRPIGDANNPTGRKRNAMLAVFVDTDDGLTGISFGSPAARPHIHSLTDSVLVGSDPRGVRGLWKRMVDFVFKDGNRGLANAAISALDVALWDLKAKANGEPLWRTLGASTRRVKVYASGIDLSLSDEELRVFYLNMAKKGIASGKLKVGLQPEADRRRLQIMYDALATSGREPELMVDSNEYWSPKQAIRHIRAFEKHFDLTWAEEPAQVGLSGLRTVSRPSAPLSQRENLDGSRLYTDCERRRHCQIGNGTTGITERCRSPIGLCL